MAAHSSRRSVVISRTGAITSPMPVSSFVGGCGQLLDLFHPPMQVRTLPVDASTRAGFLRVGHALREAMARRGGPR